MLTFASACIVGRKVTCRDKHAHSVHVWDKFLQHIEYRGIVFCCSELQAGCYIPYIGEFSLLSNFRGQLQPRKFNTRNFFHQRPRKIIDIHMHVESFTQLQSSHVIALLRYMQPRDGLPDPRRPLSFCLPSQAKAQANREVQDAITTASINGVRIQNIQRQCSCRYRQVRQSVWRSCSSSAFLGDTY